MTEQQFPEMYREQIAEMIHNRQKTNELREQAGRPVNMTVERYIERLAHEFGSEPSPMTKGARMRAVNEKLEASRRVLNNAQKGLF